MKLAASRSMTPSSTASPDESTNPSMSAWTRVESAVAAAPDRGPAVGSIGASVAGFVAGLEPLPLPATFGCPEEDCCCPEKDWGSHSSQENVSAEASPSAAPSKSTWPSEPSLPVLAVVRWGTVLVTCES